MKKRTSLIRENKGFGLLEVLIASVLGGVFLYGALKSVIVVNQSANVIKTAQAEQYLYTLVMKVLADLNDCTKNLFIDQKYFSNDGKATGILVEGDSGKTPRPLVKVNGNLDFTTDPKEDDDVRIIGPDDKIFGGALDIKSLEVEEATLERPVNDGDKGKQVFQVLYTKPLLGKHKTINNESCVPSDSNKRAGCYVFEVTIETQLQGTKLQCMRIINKTSKQIINDVVQRLKCPAGQIFTVDPNDEDGKECKSVVEFEDHDNDPDTEKQIGCREPGKYLIGFNAEGPICGEICIGGGGRFWNTRLTPPACDCPTGKTWDGLNCNE